MGIKDDDIMETLMHQNVENLTVSVCSIEFSF